MYISVLHVLRMIANIYTYILGEGEGIDKGNFQRDFYSVLEDRLMSKVA